jgi:hypothetical protein
VVYHNTEVVDKVEQRWKWIFIWRGKNESQNNRDQVKIEGYGRIDLLIKIDISIMDISIMTSSNLR